MLTSDISGQTRRINTLEGDITRLSNRQQKLQTSLDAQARRARDRAAQAARGARPADAAARPPAGRPPRARRSGSIELYKADAPDAITVVLESEGFADLLTRTEFMERVSRQDAKIMDIVSDGQGRRDRHGQAAEHAREAPGPDREQIESERDEVSTIRVGLVDRRDRIRSARSTKFALLRGSRERRHELQDDVEQLQAQQAKIQAKLAGLRRPVPPPARSRPARAG